MHRVAVFTFFTGLWLILWRQLSGEWSVNDQYSYGWFVPFFAIVLFCLRWEDRPEESKKDEVESRKQIVAIALAIVALLLLFPIRLFEIGNPDWRPPSWLHALCVVAITLVFLWSVGGTPWLRHFAFPVAFTLIAVPWVSSIEQPIVQGLMRIVASISSETVALFGIPARLEGHLIRIPDGLVGVNEACSGVRSLQTSLMVGLLFGELKRLSILRRVILVIAASAIAFIGNCIRAFVLVWIAATQNTAATERWHDFAGYGIVVLVFVGSMILAWLLGRYRKSEVRGQRSAVGSQKSEVRGHRSENPYSSFVIRHSSFLATAALVWLVAIEIAAASWYRAHEKNLAETTHWEVQWPSAAPNFHEIKIDEDVRRALRFDSGHAASWNVLAPEST